MSDLDFIRNENLSNSELELEQKLRPLSFDDFKGQARTIVNLKIFILQLAIMDMPGRGLIEEATDHTKSLLYHP